MTPAGPADRGQRTSNFHPDADKQVTQTVGVNPDPPAKHSASAPADAVPPYPACVIGPYSGMAG